MTDNVIILGAGFSHAAGIPLMADFVDRMWEYAIRESCNGQPLSREDIAIFRRAMSIRRDLDAYHGRAAFNDRNIEDILSLLSFNLIAERSKDRAKLTEMIRAITRTIELSCTVKHPGPSASGGNSVNEEGSPTYRDFWRSLIGWVRGGRSLPTIITFNYDLVLERSLFQVLVGIHYDSFRKSLPFDSLRLQYRCTRVAMPCYTVKRVTFSQPNGASMPKSIPGTILEQGTDVGARPLDIELLKLHGSVNFPSRGAITDSMRFNVAATLDSPLILPPVSNKLSSAALNQTWKAALQRLQTAKNLVIVGYSLPRTDMYMQYFLKAALGPNVDLNRIYVFDPLLYERSTSEADMCLRYEECFAPQLRSRICFRPYAISANAGKIRPGTTDHFVHVLEQSPSSILF